MGAAVDTSLFAQGMARMAALVAKFKATMVDVSKAVQPGLATSKIGIGVFAQGMDKAVQKTKAMGYALSLMKGGINETNLWLFKKSVQGLGSGLGQAVKGIAITTAGFLRMGIAASIPIAKFAAFQVIVPTIGALGKAVWSTAGLIGSAMVKVASSIASGILAITKWGIALGALAAGALVAWTASSVRGVAAQNDLTQRLGMTTEAFQKLSYAAKISGVDQEQLAGSLEKMQERLAEVAIEGGGPAADALKRFGINARDLTTMAPEQAFMRMVGVLEQIPNSMERIKVAKDIFGKSGTGMINLAMEGTASLKAMGLEASQLGVALSAIDNAKLAETDDALDKIWLAVSGVANTIAVQLSPYITAVSDQFIAWMKSGTTTGSFIAQAVDWITTAIGGLADVLQVVQIGFYSLRSLFDEIVSLMLQGIDKLIQGFGWLYEKITGTHLELTTFFKDWSELMAGASKNDIGKAMDLMGKQWAHNTVRELKNEIEIGAQKRAEAGSAKQAAFVQPGAQVTAKVAETKFAGAAEQGTAAAYSARIGAQARLFDSKQNLIVDNTAKTAAHTERIAIAVEGGKMRAGGPVDGIQYREQASGR